MPQNAPFSNNFSPIISDGSVATPNVTEIVLEGGAVVIANGGLGGGNKATYTPSGVALEVTDGSSPQTSVSEISFTGATVSSGGAGVADVSINSPVHNSGTFVANGATPVTVAATSVTANSLIIFTLKTPGGTVGAYPAIQTITPGTGFTVAATALDTSTYNYGIIK